LPSESRNDRVGAVLEVEVRELIRFGDLRDAGVGVGHDEEAVRADLTGERESATARRPRRSRLRFASRREPCPARPRVDEEGALSLPTAS
jgi:hypothetical protein